MFNISNYAKLKLIFQHLCVVLKNKYYTDDVHSSIKILLTEILDSDMIKLLETVLLNIDDENPEDEPKKPNPMLGKFFNSTLYENSPYYADFKEIMNEVTTSNSVNNSEPNPYYGEEYLIKFLKNKIAFLPWWSGLLTCKLEKRACNSHVEGYFNNIKKRVHRYRHTIGARPTKALRVMKVIRERNVLIHKQVKLEIPKSRCASTYKRKPYTKKINSTTPKNTIRAKSMSDSEGSVCSTTSIFESKDTEITLSASQKINEKWCKKSEGKRSPSSYFSKFHLKKLKLDLEMAENLPTITEEFNLIEKKEDSSENEYNSSSSKSNTSEYELPNICLNLNTTREERLPLFPVLKNSTSKFFNTCAFDSYVQVILALTDHPQITEIFEKTMCDFTLLILELRHHARLDRIRDRVLAPIYKNFKTKCCDCNINDVTDFINRSHFPNVDTTFSCDACSITFNKASTNVEINITTLENVGIANLSEAVEDTRYKKCPKCDKAMSSYNQYAPFLTIGVDLFNNSNETSQLDLIPNELILGQQEFALTGVIHYDAINLHYSAYCKRKNSQWECYDDKHAISTRVKDQSAEMVVPHSLVYLDKQFFCKN